MEDVFDFLARVGVSDPGKVLTAARLGPYATANDFASLTDLSLKSVPCGRVADDLRRAREGALRESGFLLEFSGTRGCSFGQYSHSEVGGAPGRPGQTYAGSLRLSRLATSPCPGLMPLEHIAMGHEVSAFDVANSFQWVFLESSSVRDRTRYGEGPRPYSFHDRCLASGCSFLLPRLSLDEGSTDRCARPTAPPAKRIRTSGDALSGNQGTVSTTDSDARRLPAHLAMEASLRTQLHSVMKSWRCVRSGIFSYAVFMHSVMPQVAHFPVSLKILRLWATNFDNGDTLSQYVSHLKFAHRLLGLPPLSDQPVISAIIRGTKKEQVRRPRPRVMGDSLDEIILLAWRENDLTAARAYAVAYSFLFRCHDELFGLQVDGRNSTTSKYHSHIEFVPPTPLTKRPSVSIHLASRKTSPHGEIISRPCICRKGSPSIRCGHCSLRALVDAHLHARRDRKDLGLAEPILHRLKAKSAREDLWRRGARVGVHACSWHAFRRGAASDILRSGGTIGFLMHQGGWRSSAFLRYVLRKDLDDHQALELTARGLDSDSD